MIYGGWAFVNSSIANHESRFDRIIYSVMSQQTYIFFLFPPTLYDYPFSSKSKVYKFVWQHMQWIKSGFRSYRENFELIIKTIDV